MKGNTNFDEIAAETDFTSCCTNFYNNSLVKFFLGNSYHPGGTDLTLELASKLGITSSSTVLDVACGTGTSAILLAENFGCNVTGIDLNPDSIHLAKSVSKEKELSHKLDFVTGNVDNLDFDEGSFDFIISECSFCIFNNKERIAESFFRLLRPEGKLGITDVAINKELPLDMEEMIYQVACVSGALRVEEYVEIFEQNGFRNSHVEDKRQVILDLHQSLRKKLIGLKLLKGVKPELGGIDLSSVDLKQLKTVISQVRDFVDQQYGTYFLYIGERETE